MTPAMKPSEVLLRAAELVEPEGCWTREAWARDAQGTSVSCHLDVAVCWCAYGAILRASADAGNIEKAAIYATVAAGGGDGLVDWNDAPNRTQAEVVAALRAAAELARGEGA